MARPSEYNFELCKKICDDLADGDNIKSILKDSDYPDWSTFRRWKNENSELRTLYINSQQDKAVALESEIDDTIQMLKDGELDASQANVIIQTLKWKMAKFYPKVFGDKLEIETTERQLTPEERERKIQELLEKANK